MTHLPYPVLSESVSMTALAAFILAGCAAVGPDYHPPEIAVPPQWSVTADSHTPDPARLAQWWRQFNDPVLDNLVADALTANLDLATARAQLREARARRNLAGAQLGPSVDVSTSASRSESSSESGGGNTREMYSAGFDASWEPDIFGGLRRGVEAAEADLGTSVEVLYNTQVSLVAEVARNYVDLRTSERRLNITQSSLAASGETYDLVQWRVQAELASELDLAQSRTELESTRATLPPLHTAVTEAQNRLAILLGRTPGELKSRLVATGTVPLSTGVVPVGIPADTLRQRPDVRAAERRLAAQTARLGEAEAARYPKFNLSGTLGLEALTFTGLGNGDAATRSLLGSISAPIFDSNRIRSDIEIQDALVEQARLAYQSAVLTALEDVENALVTMANAYERQARLQQAADSARETLEIAQQQYASGLVDFLTVLDSQRTLLNLDDQLAGNTGDLAIAYIQLYKALGGGWSPDPKLISIRKPS